jgi:tetratricopeptide (TPR) repeat protein
MRTELFKNWKKNKFQISKKMSPPENFFFPFIFFENLKESGKFGEICKMMQMHSISACQRSVIEQFEEALAIYTELGDRSGQALILRRLAACYMALDQFARAAELLEQALAVQPDALISLTHTNTPAHEFFGAYTPPAPQNPSIYPSRTLFHLTSAAGSLPVLEVD